MMEIEAHIAALDREGQLLVDAARSAGPDAPVASCPGWRTRNLLAHIGFVHRWATSYVATPLMEMVDEPDEPEILARRPIDEELCDWVADGHAALVRALSNASPDVRCWTFLKAPSPLAMWARRQAHETAVHRVDAELASGRNVTTLDPAFAADGVDELLFCLFGRTASSVPSDAATSTIGLEAIDRPERWTMHVSGESVAAERGLDECGVLIRGSAADLYLLLWNRKPVADLEAEGPPDLFERLWLSHNVTWS
jgi:uncharacterized protein (TIGR03083 family)